VKEGGGLERSLYPFSLVSWPRNGAKPVMMGKGEGALSRESE